MLSIREKKIRQSVEMLFAGLDDDVLKTVVLYNALGKTEEEKDAICEEIRRKKDEDLEYFNQKFEITIDKDSSEEILKLVNPEIIPITNVTETESDSEKSHDNIETNGEN